MKHLLIAAASLGLAFALPASTLAQDTAASQPAQPTPYVELVAAMQDGIDQEMVIENQLVVVRSIWQADPNMVAAEAAYPGLFDAMIDAGRPIITRQNQELQDEFRPRYVSALAEVLTEQEAARIAEFYRSPLGMKLLGGLSRTMDNRASIEGGVANGEIDMKDFDKDVMKSAGKIVGTLSAEEQAELVRLFTTDPALMKLNDLQGVVVPIRAEMEKAGMAPARQKEIEAAIQTAAQRHLAGG
ncbi:DUF2059 domain-containing protein [Qipengyuania sp. 1XM1-15A]|uniref:DUF2059 domain-containing protein n=1 Tax=Qipengyuania xiamenensis TaxID=2867237 RepID=UPI001C884CD5|nr:DUF2059 domain-containing protein [Qipengyuania xiamenensis]MBX7532999.1 DUF2059 domain-containing protein [Qipengyuania xiamenensis]